MTSSGAPGQPGHSFWARSRHWPKAPWAVRVAASERAWASPQASASVRRATGGGGAPGTFTGRGGAGAGVAPGTGTDTFTGTGGAAGVGVVVAAGRQSW